LISQIRDLTLVTILITTSMKPLSKKALRDHSSTSKTVTGQSSAAGSSRSTRSNGTRSLRTTSQRITTSQLQIHLTITIGKRMKRALRFTLVKVQRRVAVKMDAHRPDMTQTIKQTRKRKKRSQASSKC